MKIIQINIYALLILVIVSCTNTIENANNQQEINEEINEISVSEKQFTAAGMQLGLISNQSIVANISTRGYIDVPPESKAAISPFYDGFVKDIDVLPGQQVKKGERLFTLQNPEYIKIQQSYLESKEQLDYLKLDFERQQSLADEKIASQKNLKKAESDYKMLLAKCKGLEAQLKLMNISISQLEKGQMTSVIAIYAPISGNVTLVDITKSKSIKASEIAVEIVNTEHIHLELEVFEKDAAKIKLHQKIHFSLPESGKQMFDGEVYLIGKQVDMENRTIDVHGHIAEEDGLTFIPGMFVNATIEVKSDSAICLPLSAIVENDDVEYVLVKQSDNGKTINFVELEVKTLKRSSDWVEIINHKDLEGKEVLLKGAFNVAAF